MWFILRRMGWIVSQKYRFVFIHIPKTGGTSLAEPAYRDSSGALTGILGESDYSQAGHILARGLKERMGERWDDYFKFAFVRNPWDRMVSLYHYFLQDSEKQSTALGERIAACEGFADFCVRLDELEPDAHFWEQLAYLADSEGNMLVDCVGRFEHLDEDFEKICARLGMPAVTLPHLRQTAHRDYRHYYDARTVDVIAARYKNDIAAFGYSFE